MNNSTRKLCIGLEKLPIRPMQINPDEASKIFGGCHSLHEVCFPGVEKNECCPNLKCIGNACWNS
jgi:hypothetical protein